MELSPSQVAAAGAVRFASGRDVVEFFQRRVHAHFVDWFNAQCAHRAPWERKALQATPEVKQRFSEIWDQIPSMFGTPSISLGQFSALMSVLIVEAGAELLPVSEACGRDGYPGLVYAFSKIPGIKQSYNICRGNKPAGELFFRDPDFWEAHGHRPLADLVRAMPDVEALWNSEFFPEHLFSPSTDPKLADFLQQADFYKFRGRGFIQITLRANYKRLVEYVQNYAGNHPLVRNYKAKWAGKSADAVCSASSNEDWDALFQQTDLLIPCRAVGLHNEASGYYLRLSEQADVLNAGKAVAGSVYNMGLRINGAVPYALLLRERVNAMLGAVL